MIGVYVEQTWLQGVLYTHVCMYNTVDQEISLLKYFRSYCQLRIFNAQILLHNEKLGTFCIRAALMALLRLDCRIIEDCSHNLCLFRAIAAANREVMEATRETGGPRKKRGPTRSTVGAGVYAATARLRKPPVLCVYIATHTLPLSFRETVV